MTGNKDFLLSRLSKQLPLAPPVERCAAPQRPVRRRSGRALVAPNLRRPSQLRQSGQGAEPLTTHGVCSESFDADFKLGDEGVALVMVWYILMYIFCSVYQDLLFIDRYW